MEFIIQFIIENIDILALLFVIALTIAIYSRSFRIVLLTIMGLGDLYLILAILYNYGYGCKVLYDWSVDAIVSILMVFRYIFNVVHSSFLHVFSIENIVGILYFILQNDFSFLANSQKLTISCSVEVDLNYLPVINKARFNTIKYYFNDFLKKKVTLSSFGFILRV